ncbi:MAG: asparaginase [Bacteroidetes bacterium]|nr:asparaginase [Bacteroidota bacterium]
MKILFIQTGGTIDKDYPKNMGGYAFEISEPAIDRIMKKLNPSFEYEILPLIKKDSLDISEKDREMLFDVIQRSPYEKIIVTHGTDSMIETASFLSKIKHKTLVLTGAMRPEKFSDSDADLNIGLAIGAVQLKEAGVFIAMQGCIFRWDEVKRHPESGQFLKA